MMNFFSKYGSKLVGLMAIAAIISMLFLAISINANAQVDDRWVVAPCNAVSMCYQIDQDEGWFQVRPNCTCDALIVVKVDEGFDITPRLICEVRKRVFGDGRYNNNEAWDVENALWDLPFLEVTGWNPPEDESK